MGGAWFQKTQKVYFSIVKEAALTFSELPTSIRKQAAWRDHGSRIMQDQSEQRNCPRRSYRSTGLYIHNWQKRRGFLMLVSKRTFLINLPLKTHVVTLDRFDEHTLFKFPLIRITEIKFSKSFFFSLKKLFMTCDINISYIVFVFYRIVAEYIKWREIILLSVPEYKNAFYPWFARNAVFT